MAINTTLPGDLWSGLYGGTGATSHPPRQYNPVPPEQVKDFRVLAAEGAIRDAENQAYEKKKEIRARRRAALRTGSTSSAYKRHKKREAKEQTSKVERECRKRIEELQKKITDFEYEKQQQEYKKYVNKNYGLGSVGSVSSSNTFQIGSSPTKSVSFEELERLVRAAEEKQKRQLAKRTKRSLESEDD